MPTNKQLAEYKGVSISAIDKWDATKRHRASVEMQSGAEPQIIKLIGEISQLCYIFDCKHVVGDLAERYAVFLFGHDHARLCIYNSKGKNIFPLPEIDLSASTAVAELQKVKATLESFIY